MWEWLRNVLAGTREPTKGDCLSTQQAQPGVRTLNCNGVAVQLDTRRQRLMADVPRFSLNRFFWLDSNGRSILYPTLQAANQACYGQGIPSGATLSQKAKRFDDRLYATVDMAAQKGCGTFAGKAQLLRRITDCLGDDPINTSLLAAAALGDVETIVPPSLQEAVTVCEAEFLAEPMRSKPIGFYTWNKDLERIFQQDRMLQSHLRGDIARAATAVAEEKTYAQYLELISRLTNPLSKSVCDLRAPKSGEDCAFFPPSRAHETDLIMALYGDTAIPDDFCLADEMISRARSGKLDLTPNAESGWYDMQTWALSALIEGPALPEATKITFGEDYQKALDALFKGALALTRETHIKQLEGPPCSGVPRTPQKSQLFISPGLTVEPLYSYYRRRARSYDFVEALLTETFGKEGLAALPVIGEDGPTGSMLLDELNGVRQLFAGAARTVQHELGLEGDPAGSDEDQQAFAAWAERDDDPDLDRDVRMMVPLCEDVVRSKIKFWLFLGWSVQEVRFDFFQTPPVQVVDKEGVDIAHNYEIMFTHQGNYLAYPVFAEVSADRPLNRSEFRTLCDKHQTAEAILAALSGQQ